jgi:serine/threonine protein kinase
MDPEADPELVPTVLIAPPRMPDLGLFPTGGFRGLPADAETLPDKFGGFPKIGDRLENCRLVAELGRGGSGLVFLAQQEALANRPIVLKVTTDSTRGEHLNLARLQHTHIMPLYWASALRFEGLHVLAMPYLARTTLARLLYYLESSPKGDWTGKRIAGVLEGEQNALGIPIAIHEHPAEILKESTWVEFVVRIGEMLAETLSFVHRRNLVHLDLKPSNVLITPDGQPILLDLDIACQPVAAGTTTLPWLGGTSEFMSPEQRVAIAALRIDKPVPEVVDGRSDMYSLGLMLYAALSGVCIPEGKPDLPKLRTANPDVSPGLAAILTRCLAEDQNDRYPDCHALAEDLRRHEQNLPLRGVRNQWSERWQKWRKRRPLGLPLILLLGGFCSIAAVGGLNYYSTTEDHRKQAEAALLDGQELQRKGQHEAAIHRFLAGKELVEQSRGNEQLVALLNTRMLQTQRMQKAEELAKMVQLMRFASLLDRPTRRFQWVMEGAGRKLWAERTLLLDDSSGALESAAERDIRDQLQEFVLLWGALHVELVPPEHTAAARRDVWTLIEEAEQLFGSTVAIGLARERLEEPRANIAPTAMWEFCAVGREAMAKGDLDAANRAFQSALEREPLGFVPNFHLGVCALRQKDYERAVRIFSFCAGQDPKPSCFLLRGQAYAALNETDAALKDFNLALEKYPELVTALEARAKLYRKLGRVAEAEKDEEHARKLSE